MVRYGNWSRIKPNLTVVLFAHIFCESLPRKIVKAFKLPKNGEVFNLLKEVFNEL